MLTSMAQSKIATKIQNGRKKTEIQSVIIRNDQQNYLKSKLADTIQNSSQKFIQLKGYAQV